MTQERWVVFSLAAYFLLFLGTAVGLTIWKAKRSRTRPPVEFKFLRGPGESLRQRMTKFDEDFLLRIGGAAMAPVLIALAAFWVVIKFRPETWTQLWVGRAITGLAFVVTLALAMRWALRALMRYRDDRLGYCRDVVD